MNLPFDYKTLFFIQFLADECYLIGIFSTKIREKLSNLFFLVGDIAKKYNLHITIDII